MISTQAPNTYSSYQSEEIGKIIYDQTNKILNQSLCAHIQQILRAEGHGFQQESGEIGGTVESFVMRLLEDYSEVYEYFTALLAKNQQIAREETMKRENETNMAISMLENKLIMLQKEYQQRLVKQQQESQQKIDTIQSNFSQKYNKITQQLSQKQSKICNQSQQLQKNCTIIQQHSNKLHKLQSQIQKYEYQLQQKSSQICQYEEALQIAIRESCLVRELMAGYQERILGMFQQEVWVSGWGMQAKRECLEKQQEVIQIMSKYYQMCISNQSNQHVPIPEDPQIESEQVEAWGEFDIFKQIKQQTKVVEGNIGKLVNSHRQQGIKYHNLSHKYAQFLKETQSKLQECKTKITELQKEKNQSNNQLEEVKAQLQLKQAQIRRLVQLLKTNLDSYKNNTESHQNKLQSLTQQLQSKSQTIHSLQLHHKTQCQRMDKYILTLTLQIQSLKQSISTLKNVVHLQKDKDEPQQTVDAAIVQQMIDKTYQIRLENAKLKDYVEQLKGHYEEQAKILENMQMQRDLFEKQVNLSKMDNQKLSAQVQALSLRVQRYEKQIQILQQQVKQQMRLKEQQAIEYEAIKADLQRQCRKVTDLIHRIENTQNQNARLANITEMLALEVDVNKKVVEIPIQHYSTYERMQIQQLQISVLNSIISNLRNDLSKHTNSPAKYSIQVQVDFNRVSQFQAEDLNNQESAETIRAFRNRCPSSIGCLVNVRNNQKKWNQKQNQSRDENKLGDLNKTCKIRGNPGQQNSKNQIEELNDLINYMVNYLKGYTRNGVRKQSWLASQGEEYLMKVQTSKNIKQKYGTFQRVRTLMSKNQSCKQLVKDYEKIANFYFASLSINRIDEAPIVSNWQKQEKRRNQQSWTTHNKTTIKESMVYSK